MKKIILWILLVFSIFIGMNESLAVVNDVHFIATELLGRPTDTSVTVNAVADAELEIFIEYGIDSGFYTSQTDTMIFPARESIELTIENLKPNILYYYRMRYRQSGEADFRSGTQHTFHTQRPRGSTFKFAIQTDSHLYDKKCNPELYHIALQNVLVDTPDFLIDMGDTFGNDHDTTMDMEELFQLYLDQRYFFETVCHSVPLFLCLGNHEVEYTYYMNGTAENIAVYATQARKFYYSNPFPDTFYSGNTTVEDFVGLPENYYAWEWGDALFIVLDAYRYLTTSQKPREWDWTIGEKQYQWFKETLEGSRAAFKFVFIHHVLGQTRGGMAWADKFEWGGYNQQGIWEFDTQRPGWGKPIHQLMVDNNVTIFFQGHDHIFAKEEFDGMVYQECPMPSDATYNVGAENEDDYSSGVVRKNSGHLRITVSDKEVTVDYIRACLPQDETTEYINGKVAYSYTIKAADTSIPSKKSSVKQPEEFNLNQNFPNPFNPATHITFQIPCEDQTTLRIYNSMGQLVRILLDTKLNAGEYTVPWDGSDDQFRRVGSGIYFYELQTNVYRRLKKAVLLQ